MSVFEVLREIDCLPGSGDLVIKWVMTGVKLSLVGVVVIMSLCENDLPNPASL